MTAHSMDEQTRRRKIRRNVIWLVVTASVIYGSYIAYLYSWMRSG